MADSHYSRSRGSSKASRRPSSPVSARAINPRTRPAPVESAYIPYTIPNMSQMARETSHGTSSNSSRHNRHHSPRNDHHHTEHSSSRESRRQSRRDHRENDYIVEYAPEDSPKHLGNPFRVKYVCVYSTALQERFTGPDPDDNAYGVGSPRRAVTPRGTASQRRPSDPTPSVVPRSLSTGESVDQLHGRYH
ncbi:hypothetical protein J8273_0262 [Carpediemonas membranifera]|uniref:Uncharacterized protein n=1 Tax=Carpediemonas membranifera TaxID=201153 RepID=A0A8J6E2S9_9EUKA|nr:hypothetical protein J8273_0262 [Carpediemonas membranifera]|eukprot:KAG9395048.1 hypothetical protein J8273_0262 [Carpediemonas membranifera]